MSIRPIFVFSAPRSGSTLLQRVLGAYDDIATASEPWVLLPMLSPLRSDVPPATGLGDIVHEALEDFLAVLPQGRADYLAAVRAAALRLYAAAAGRDDGWFVDKTPTYHFIADEIIETFPDGRFIFLWRQPLSVVASAVELFGEGRWEVNRYTTALFRSMDDLVAAGRRYADVAHAVRFEDLVGGGEQPWRSLLDYIGLPYEPATLERFTEVRLEGRKGDPTGVRRYAHISFEPVEKWRETITNPVRKAWCRRYLLWLGDDRLSHMGYELERLLAELDAIDTTTKGSLADIGRLAASVTRDAAKRVVPPHSGGPSVWPALLGSDRRGRR